MKRFVLMLALICLTACGDRTRGMETRSYELSRLSTDEAVSLLTPYIREGGYLSGKNRLISVREKPDRLTLIEDMLRKYDGIGQAVDIALEIRVVEANGFEQQDPALADVEQTLRQTFKYRGYKVIGQALVRAREDGKFSYAGNNFILSGQTQRLTRVGSEQRLPVEIDLQVAKVVGLGSTVTTTIGKSVVLGQSTATGAIILVMKPSIVQ